MTDTVAATLTEAQRRVLVLTLPTTIKNLDGEARRLDHDTGCPICSERDAGFYRNSANTLRGLLAVIDHD